MCVVHKFVGVRISASERGQRPDLAVSTTLAIVIFVGRIVHY